MKAGNIIDVCPAQKKGLLGSGGTIPDSTKSRNFIEPGAPYPMSMLRAALHSFSKLYGDRYARYNIDGNNLLPGFCENVNLSEFAQSSIPAQRPASFEEIGQSCVFLASEAARYINGQSILSDGGMNRAVR
jgi:NAD(P)-dependent dehydrogenase (short-subunit alcohol dehydrogenase family)